MSETTELFDNWLKLELLDHYERMTTKKRMSTMSMQQWLAGAAIHLHVRIHQVRTGNKQLKIFVYIKLLCKNQKLSSSDNHCMMVKIDGAEVHILYHPVN